MINGIIRMTKMIFYHNWISISVFFVLFTFFMFIAAIISGCSTAGTAIPQGGPTMAEVYEEAMQQSKGESLDKVRDSVNHNINSPIVMPNDISVLTRNPDNEINQLFPVLPNPQIVMYVTPHFADNELPVPGYTTAFPLYDKFHYAMPGELSNY